MTGPAGTWLCHEDLEEMLKRSCSDCQSVTHWGWNQLLNSKRNEQQPRSLSSSPICSPGLWAGVGQGTYLVLPNTCLGVQCQMPGELKNMWKSWASLSWKCWLGETTFTHHGEREAAAIAVIGSHGGPLICMCPQALVQFNEPIKLIFSLHWLVVILNRWGDWLVQHLADRATNSNDSITL